MEAPIQQDSTEVQAVEAPQGTETQPQSVTPSQVEGGQSTSQEDVRQKSEFETARQIKNLMKEIRSLKQSFETRSSVQQPAPQTMRNMPVTREELLNNPLDSIDKIAESKVERFRQEIEKRDSEARAERSRQEGLRLIETNESIKRDPEGIERMKDILAETDDDGNSLDSLSQTNPKYAAQLAVKEYLSRYGTKKTVAAPSKAQMASTATSQTVGAARNTDQEVAQIHAELTKFPDLVKDPQFMAKMSAIIKKSDTERMMGK